MNFQRLRLVVQKSLLLSFVESEIYFPSNFQNVLRLSFATSILLMKSYLLDVSLWLKFQMYSSLFGNLNPPLLRLLRCYDKTNPFLFSLFAIIDCFTFTSIILSMHRTTVTNLRLSIFSLILLKYEDMSVLPLLSCCDCEIKKLLFCMQFFKTLDCFRSKK